MQLLHSGHVRERDKALLRGILAGGVWNGFLLEKVKGQRVPCHFSEVITVEVSGASSAGSGCFTFRNGRLWADWRWGHLDDDVGDGRVVRSCRGFCSVPGPL